MFSLKAFQSNISSNYQYSPHPSFYAGPWRVHDGKKKSTGDRASIFILDKKAVQNQSHQNGLAAASSSSSSATLGGSSGFKRAYEEAFQRLKREASCLARLRHPSILQVIEPVEETRNGGLMFATEPVTASLSGILQEKDDQEIAAGGRASRYVEGADGSRRRRDQDSEIEIDEIEIQKGLLQVAKGLEFLHESAGLVHGNLTPDAILVNTKSDWKITGLGFSGPPDEIVRNSTTTSVTASSASTPPLALSEVLYHDPRLSTVVQLNLDFTSPDFVLDSNISFAADMFSLGLLIVSLYNSPHRSPIQSHQNPSTYKKLMSTSSSIPSANNSFLCSRPIPRELKTSVLPRLITRRPVQRINAREFQQSGYFDNVLVSTIRFLETFPAKTQSEKAQFLRGLRRVLDDFPSSVLQKKVLPALLEEAKDKELLPLILQNAFRIIKRNAAAAPRIVPDLVVPRLREIFLSSSSSSSATRQTASASASAATVTHQHHNHDAALIIVLDNLSVLAENLKPAQFKEDILPLVHKGLDSHTHALTDAALKCLPILLPILDFVTVKDEVFPPVANVFSRTNSLQIKVRALDGFYLLCGGRFENASTPSIEDEMGEDDLTGLPQASTAKRKATQARTSKALASSILDKYTVQEKLFPLLKSMKTKEPAVMMSALRVLRQITVTNNNTPAVDTTFLAFEVLPLLWYYSLGPLLNVSQFDEYMVVIKAVSAKVEKEQREKLGALSETNETSGTGASSDGMELGGPFGALAMEEEGTVGEVKSDFERLVLGYGGAATSTASKTSSLSRGRSEDDGGWSNWNGPSVTSGMGGSNTPAASPFSLNAMRPQPQQLQKLSPQSTSASAGVQNAPRFSWSSATPANAAQPSSPGIGGLGVGTSNVKRSITPDSGGGGMKSYPVLAPSGSTSASTPTTSRPTTGMGMGMNLQPLQPQQPQQPMMPRQNSWAPGMSSATNNASNATSSPLSLGGLSASGPSNPATKLQSSNILSSNFSAPLPAATLPPPPPPPLSSASPLTPRTVSQGPWGTPAAISRPGASTLSNRPMNTTVNPSPATLNTTSLQMQQQQPQPSQPQKSGLDKYESLL